MSLSLRPLYPIICLFLWTSLPSLGFAKVDEYKICFDEIKELYFDQITIGDTTYFHYRKRFLDNLLVRKFDSEALLELIQSTGDVRIFYQCTPDHRIPLIIKIMNRRDSRLIMAFINKAIDIDPLILTQPLNVIRWNIGHYLVSQNLMGELAYLLSIAKNGEEILNASDKGGWSLLDVAIYYSHADIVDYLHGKQLTFTQNSYDVAGGLVNKLKEKRRNMRRNPKERSKPTSFIPVTPLRRILEKMNATSLLNQIMHY